MRFQIVPVAFLRISALVMMVFLTMTAGCADGNYEYRTIDLVADGGLLVDGTRLRPEEMVVADETWVAVTVAAGETARASIELFRRPGMEMAGILECGEGASGSSGTLAITIRGEKRRVDEDIDVSSEDGWWRRYLDLSNAPRGRAQLNLHADLPKGCALRLRKVSVDHSRRVEARGDEPRSQVLLISVDTLRHDGVRTVDGAVFPGLQNFAEEAESWVDAYAAASWTKPSHASLLTGFHPDTHRAILLDQAIDSALPTLAERFRQAGFATAGLVYDCTWLSPRWGFGKGFDDYRVTRFRAVRQATRAAEWMLDHRDRDFFFFLHTFEPHSDFARLPYEAPLVNRTWIEERFGVKDFGCRQGTCAASFVNALDKGEVQEQETDRAVLRATYDEGVRYTDTALSRLFQTLRRSGLWDDLVVVVTSDHGEEFGEHGGYGHHTVHEEILRVPLLIKWPEGERAGEVNRTACSAVDIAPTLLEHYGLPATDLPGTHLRRRTAEIPVLAGTLEKAVISGNFKGIFDGKKPPRLFDLESDPGEKNDLATQHPEIVRQLREILNRERGRALELFRRIGSQAEEPQVVLSERDRQRLEAFGYLQ